MQTLAEARERANHLAYVSYALCIHWTHQPGTEWGACSNQDDRWTGFGWKCEQLETGGPDERQ